VSNLEARLALIDTEIVYGKWGDTKHYEKRRKAEAIVYRR